MPKKCPTIKHRLFSKRILKWSSPKKAQMMAHKYLGKTAKLYPSERLEKKYQICDPKKGHYVRFGQMGYKDFTRHKNKARRRNYLTRTANMLGNWKHNKYSANNLSRNILW